MAEPIRVLEEVLAWVRHGALDPDMGRLGRWTIHPSKVKEDALTRLTQEITELKEKLTLKASLGELHVRKADEDLGDDASCALSSSEDEISEDECPKALGAAAGIAEAAAAVIQIPVTDELRQHPEAATALQGTEQWEGGLAPPPSTCSTTGLGTPGTSTRRIRCLATCTCCAINRIVDRRGNSCGAHPLS